MQRNALLRLTHRRSAASRSRGACGSSLPWSTAPPIRRHVTPCTLHLAPCIATLWYLSARGITTQRCYVMCIATQCFAMVCVYGVCKWCVHCVCTVCAHGVCVVCASVFLAWCVLPGYHHHAPSTGGAEPAADGGRGGEGGTRPEGVSSSSSSSSKVVALVVALVVVVVVE